MMTVKEKMKERKKLKDKLQEKETSTELNIVSCEENKQSSIDHIIERKKLKAKLEEKKPSQKVTQNDVSCEENNQSTVDYSRKRKRQPEKWKRNFMKMKREAGEEYINIKGDKKRNKMVRTGCQTTCNHNCSTKISTSERENIMIQFYSLSDDQKYKYYNEYTERKQTERKRTQKQNSRRKHSFVYYLPCENTKQKVCKKFFCTTLDISVKRIYHFYKKKDFKKTKITPTPKKGRTAYNYRMADKPDEMDLTDLPLSSRSNAPVETQDVASSTSATPFAEPPTIAAPKSSAQRQREYRQRIAASRSPAQSTATRISETERKRNYRLRKAANLALPSGSLESTTAPSSRSAEELNKQALQVTIARIEANPQLYIGIPKNCYHLVNLLRKKTRVPTVHILMCLKKVKLDTHFEELADQFGILASQAKHIFVAKLPLIAKSLHSFIVNLDNSAEAVQSNLPIPFRTEFQNAACIVDSLELKIQPTKDLAETASERMDALIKNDLTRTANGNMVKYLISSSPDGFINFVSPGYGGWNSDENLLENTKYIERFKPGSCIVVKNGFRNAEPFLSERGLHLFRPGVTQGPTPGLISFNKVNSLLELKDHVERVVQRVRGFSMVNERSVISADLVSVVDDAVVVSCALNNLQSFVIN